MPKVSFARDIRPLFRDVDISHMERHGIKLDDYTFMSDPDNANKVLETLSPHEGDPRRNQVAFSPSPLVQTRRSRFL